MTNSATSTERDAAPRVRPAAAKPADAPSGFRPWHFFILISMAGATVAVTLSVHTHPVALLLLSAAVVCAGVVGLALHRAIEGFFERGGEPPLPSRAYEDLLREKALVLRSIKELEFDKAMGKVSDADFADISSRLRARALALMADLDRAPAPREAKREAAPAQAPAAAAAVRSCATCGTANDTDARFCKNCGSGLKGSK